ncbi:MAG: kelch repeat-containing protein [Ignavibacteriaceae bacterium]
MSVHYTGGKHSSQYGPVLKTVEEYDPDTDTWKQKADMHTARGWHTASVVDGKIYVIGGASDSYTDPNISSIEVYNPDTDTWTIVGEMLTVRRMFSASVVDGNIYTIGGITDGWSNKANASAKVEVFNPGINITDISEINTEIKQYSLHQNYPNPFNPSTTIKYSIPKQSYVTLKLYDILGREVATLVNAEKPSGNYQVEFNAANLPSGVYFYRIQAGSFNQVRKMLLIK